MRAEHAPRILQLLLNYSTYLDAAAGETRMSVLNWAAVHGMVPASGFLISRGLDMEKLRCLRDKTSFILAADKGTD
ncbi:hypothetical protein EJ02DRAFT_452324 [Clathrospora elynae]|uniref:Ankyrin n=1 Tax=Clathrospora elynae TaxID=706981 RepID=A0A6A5SW40_9PLEO|nr:hypothetical protein EJ02DRAFT_452324 [Clathrospora elynae]